MRNTRAGGSPEAPSMKVCRPADTSTALRPDSSIVRPLRVLQNEGKASGNTVPTLTIVRAGYLTTRHGTPSTPPSTAREGRAGMLAAEALHAWRPPLLAVMRQLGQYAQRGYRRAAAAYGVVYLALIRPSGVHSLA